MSFLEKINCGNLLRDASDDSLPVIEPHSEQEQITVRSIEQENLRCLVMSGIPLKRIG
jgi:hypothetical protein